MDKTVMLWDITSGQVLKIFRGHLGRVSCVRVNQHSTVAASGSIDGTIRCWDCKGRKNEVSALPEMGSAYLSAQNVVAKLSHIGSRVVLSCLLTATEVKFHLWKSEQLANSRGRAGGLGVAHLLLIQ
ncbi:WD repeat-containing protein 83 [Chamberlinius hualienensis]